MRIRNSTVARLALLAFSSPAALAIATPAYAQTEARKREFHIPAQPLSSALMHYSRQSDIPVVAPMTMLEGKRGRAVNGTMLPAEALKRLLAGTSLRPQRNANGGLTLTEAPGESTGDRTSSMGDGVANDAESFGADDAGSEIVVTAASRLGRAGIDAPTPVSILDARLLQEAGRTHFSAALNDQPQFKASFAPQNNGANFTAGTNQVDLRGLGYKRTLILIDGRRTVADSDLNLIPSAMVERVEVVTGSASAAWGSGAVAGVVNIVLDKKIEGLKANAQISISSRGDAGERSFNMATGASFADGRGHIVIGGEYVINDALSPKTSRANTGRWAVVPNPAYTATNGQKPLILAPDVGIANVSPGGLILSGVNAGRTFNPDGTLRAFDLGRVAGTLSIGGEAPSNDDVFALLAPSERYSVMGRVAYDLTDAITLTADIGHARVHGSFPFFTDPNRGNLTIASDNAFLPQAIRTQMAAAGETSFTFGRFNTDFALIGLDYQRVMNQGTLALKARLGGNWTLDGFYHHGEVRNEQNLSNLRIDSASNPAFRNFRNSVDAVIDPATGLAACRINIDANPNNNDAACVPINLFGEGAPSQAARDYATGDSFYHAKRTLDVGGLTLRGEPLDLPAGSVSVAVGAEARRDKLVARVSSLDTAKAFAFNNFSAFSGKNTTKEAFAEVSVPLIHDTPLLQRLEFNGAARITHDATGSIWSWKLGLTDEVVEGLRLRGAHSRDIRAPDLEQLFGNAGVTQLSITDPATNQSYFITQFINQNSSLRPEASITTTAGFTFTPRAIPALRLFADYYDIGIKTAIGSLGAQDLINRCFRGNTSLCANITRGANGLITNITGSLFNFSRLTTRGIDATLDYSVPVASLESSGRIGVRSAATWVRDFEVNDGLVTVDYVRSQNVGFGQGVPRWRVNSTLYYESDRLRADIRGRYISAGYYDKTRAIQNNRIPAYFYVDLGLAATVKTSSERSFEIYGNVVNLFDKDPPIESRNTVYYDVIGRYFSAGARVKF